MCDASTRASIVRNAVHLSGLDTHSHDRSPTRLGGVRRLDHVVVNDEMLGLDARGAGVVCWAYESFDWSVRSALGNDHVLVIHEMLLKPCPQGWRRRPACPRAGGKSGKHIVVETGVLPDRVRDFLACSTMPDFEPLRPLRYEDPDSVKLPCTQCQQTASQAQRALISVQIHFARKTPDCSGARIWLCGPPMGRGGLDRNCRGSIVSVELTLALFRQMDSRMLLPKPLYSIMTRSLWWKPESIA